MGTRCRSRRTSSVVTPRMKTRFLAVVVPFTIETEAVLTPNSPAKVAITVRLALPSSAGSETAILRRSPRTPRIPGRRALGCTWMSRYTPASFPVITLPGYGLVGRRGYFRREGDAAYRVARAPSPREQARGRRRHLAHESGGRRGTLAQFAALLQHLRRAGARCLERREGGRSCWSSSSHCRVGSSAI